MVNPNTIVERKNIGAGLLVGATIGLLSVIVCWLPVSLFAILLGEKRAPELLVTVALGLPAGAIAGAIGTRISMASRVLQGTIIGTLVGLFSGVMIHIIWNLILRHSDVINLLDAAVIIIGWTLMGAISSTISTITGGRSDSIGGAVVESVGSAMGGIVSGALPSVIYLLLHSPNSGTSVIAFVGVAGAISGGVLGALFGIVGGLIDRRGHSSIGRAVGAAFGGSCGALFSFLLLFGVIYY